MKKSISLFLALILALTAAVVPAVAETTVRIGELTYLKSDGVSRSGMLLDALKAIQGYSGGEPRSTAMYAEAAPRISGFFLVRIRQITAPSSVPSSSADAEIRTVIHRPPRMVFQDPSLIRIA